MSELGKAYIEVTADLKKFPAELRAKLKTALHEGLAGVEFTELDKKAEKAGESAAQHVRRGFSRSAKTELLHAGEEGGSHILGGLRKIFSRNSSSGSGFFSGVGSFFKDVFSQVGGAVQSGVSGLGDIGKNVGGAFSKLGDVGGEIGGALKVGALAILIPTVLQLAGAVVQLGGALFALPAAAGVAAAAIAPLIIAFQGVGEAVSAGLSGDTEKFNQALKGLAPSARSVVKEVVGLGPAFKAIKSSVQEAFFRPLIGALKPLATFLLPALGRGLSIVATQLGKFAAGFVDLLNSNDIVDDLNDLFASTARIVATMAPSLINLFGVLFGVMEKGLPFVERFFGFVAKGIDAFTAFLSRIQESGQINVWMERAAHILKTIITIARQLGDYLITLFGGEIGDNGTEFLDQFRDKLQDLLTYLKSPEGKETIHNLGVLLKWAGEAFLALVAAEPKVLRGLNSFFNAVRTVVRVLEDIGGAVVVAAKAVGDFFVAVWRWITSAGSAIGNFFTKTIPSWWDSVVVFFASLPDKVVAALRAFKDAGEAFLIDAMTSWYQQVLQWVGNIIGIIWSLPQLIPAAFDVLKTNILNSAQAIWDGAVAIFWEGVHEVEAVFLAIPGLLSAAGNAIWSFITDLWQRTVVDAYNNVVAGFNKVVAFFSSLPDRIRAIGPALYLAAVQLGHKIGDGLANIGTFASDVGRKIVDTIKSGINWVIRSINSGIAEIDDKLPGTLPRIPQLARGAVVDSPTMALIGEAGPEVVVPLTDKKRAQQLAEQSGLLSMLRAPGGGGNTQVIVYLDPEGVIIPMTKVVVRKALDNEADELDYARAA